MNKCTLLLSSALVATGTIAFADGTGFQGAQIELSYSAMDHDDLDKPIDDYAANFSAAFNLTPQFGIQVGAGYNTIGTVIFAGDDFDVGFNITDLNAHAYFESSMGKIGLFVANASQSAIEFTNGVNTMSIPTAYDILTYGAEAKVNYNGFEIEARYGIAEISNFIIPDLNELLDISFAELDGSYQITEQFAVLGDYHYTRYDVDGVQITYTTMGGGVEYSPTEQISLLVGAEIGRADFEGEYLDRFGYYGQVDFAATDSIAVFGRVGTTNLTDDYGLDEDILSYQVGVNFSFGDSSDELFSRHSLF